jgi:hypothetical protein
LIKSPAVAGLFYARHLIEAASRKIQKYFDFLFHMTKPNLPASPPSPPRKPEPHECCGTGCIPCVMDIYEEELWQYEKDLKAREAASKAENTGTAS